MSKGLKALEDLMSNYYEMCEETGNNDDQYQRCNLTSERAIIEGELERLETLEEDFMSLTETNMELVQENAKNQKKLKALEIIKEKKVDVGGLKYAIQVAISYKATMINANTKEFIEPYIYYNMPRPKHEWLTEEEYDLLKEVLL